MQKKSFIVTVEGEDLDFESINLFARLSGAWDGVYVTVEEAAQPAPSLTKATSAAVTRNMPT
jgi:hypothetical protein